MRVCTCVCPRITLNYIQAERRWRCGWREERTIDMLIFSLSHTHTHPRMHARRVTGGEWKVSFSISKLFITMRAWNFSLETKSCCIQVQSCKNKPSSSNDKRLKLLVITGQFDLSHTKFELVVVAQGCHCCSLPVFWQLDRIVMFRKKNITFPVRSKSQLHEKLRLTLNYAFKDSATSAGINKCIYRYILLKNIDLKKWTWIQQIFPWLGNQYQYSNSY